MEHYEHRILIAYFFLCEMSNSKHIEADDMFVNDV